MVNKTLIREHVNGHVVAYFTYHPGIHLKLKTKNTENLEYNSRCFRLESKEVQLNYSARYKLLGATFSRALFRTLLDSLFIYCRSEMLLQKYVLQNSQVQNKNLVLYRYGLSNS